MPVFRGTDAVGVSAQEIAVRVGTQKGYYSYIKTTYKGGEVISRQTFADTRTNIPASKFEAPSNVGGTFHGSGTKITLPIDVSYGERNGVTGKIVYSEFYVHMEYEVGIRQWTTPVQFNVVGSYAHSKINISVDPSLCFTKSGIEGAISFSNFGIVQDQRAVMILAEYIP